MRLDKLLYEFESEANALPYVATIAADGSVKVTHSKRDDIEFPNEDAFQQWKDDNNLSKGDNLKIFVVNIQNAQGKPPKEI